MMLGKRVAFGLLAIIVASVLIFLGVQAFPGDPAEVLSALGTAVPILIGVAPFLVRPESTDSPGRSAPIARATSR